MNRQVFQNEPVDDLRSDHVIANQRTDSALAHNWHSDSTPFAESTRGETRPRPDASFPLNTANP